MPPVKMPLGKLPTKKIAPRKIASHHDFFFFLDFFLSLGFIFMRIFVRKKNQFSFN